MKIEKAKTGFCYGVRRALDTLEKAADEHGPIETLGAVVHNDQVQQKLAGMGITAVKGADDVKGKLVATSSHGVSPAAEKELKNRGLEVISTTCPFVSRAQIAARRLAAAGFQVIVYGDADHPEVKGILGWAGGKGIAAVSVDALKAFEFRVPHRIGILSQTTQVPEEFTAFAKQVIDLTFTRDAEIRLIDTICHDIRERQASAAELAGRADVMLVVGGRSSANTKHLAELCSKTRTTHLIETAADLDPAWFKGVNLVGICAGASTAEETVEEVRTKVSTFQS